MNKEIAQRRLVNQRLVGKKFRTPAEVVSWMGAVQGQEYPFAKWALGLRIEGATDAVVENALNNGYILRTHVMRPTWHFVARADIRWLVELTAPRVHKAMAFAFRQVELDKAVVSKCNKIIAKALGGGNSMTRKELQAVLEKSGVAVGGAARMSFIMLQAELDALVCSGPRRDNQFTYMLLDERAPDAKRLSRDEAVRELTRRYFASHGPATLNDFAWWSGLTVADGKAGLASLGPKVESETIDGQAYWHLGEKTSGKDAQQQAHFLPVLDEYIVAYRDPGIIYAPQFAVQAKNRNFVSCIEMGGRIVGEWKPASEKEMHHIGIKPFAPFSPSERRVLNAAAIRFGKFLGQKVILAQE